MATYKRSRLNNYSKAKIFQKEMVILVPILNSSLDALKLEVNRETTKKPTNAKKCQGLQKWHKEWNDTFCPHPIRIG